MNNYTIYHCHTMLSNGVTNIDSVTSYADYIKAALDYGMNSLGFSEHGSVFEWYKKKTEIEKTGMKYIHGEEFYLTSTLDEKIHDNMHCILIAKNYDGLKELNRLSSISFNRNDNHFYYTPRISIEELFNTSDNIIITTACLAGPLSKLDGIDKAKFICRMEKIKHRCFLEIQHHIDPQQIEYNRMLEKLSVETGIQLIAGTDTHCLNQRHAEARAIMQRSKGIHFDSEDNFNLTLMSYDELIKAYELQASLSKDVYIRAIDRTNELADMIEEYSIDTNTKYPHIYSDSEKVFKEKVNEGYKENKYISSRYKLKDIRPIIENEYEVYKKVGAFDFMLLERYLVEWERRNGIQRGYGRGSVNGSIIAYLMGITNMDSIKFDLNFFRFMNPDRVTNADVDVDYSGKDRDAVKTFLLRDKMELPQIKTSEIITFNTIKLKGVIKDVARALGIPLEEAQEISDAVFLDEKHNQTISESYRKKYKELFEYADILVGLVVSIGSHPSGVLVSDRNIDEEVGLCTISGSEYPVSQLYMKELDDLMYVKLDILGLDNIGVINETCRLAGIERLTPDNVDLNDSAVWDSIRDDTTLIFQWESDDAQDYIRRFLSESTIEKAKERSSNFSMLKWLSFGNAAIRPAGASFRDRAAAGEAYDNGLSELNEFLSKTLGYLSLQEDIMMFLQKFCGYSGAESDNVRRAIAKKKGTETLLPEIEQRFIEYTSTHYNATVEKCEEVIKPFLQVILDASDYGFSWNHSDAYSALGYICGWLRYYYPIEFITSGLNIFSDDQDKTGSIIKYANKRGIKILPIKFRHSTGVYSFNKEENVIYKGIASIKYLNEYIAETLYSVRDKQYNRFTDLLEDIAEMQINSRQVRVLIMLDFFSEFGGAQKLMRLADMFDLLYSKNSKKFKKLLDKSYPDKLGVCSRDIERFSGGITEKSYTKVDARSFLSYLEDTMPNKTSDVFTKIRSEVEYLGYAETKEPNFAGLVYIVDTKLWYGKYELSCYSVKNGTMFNCNMNNKDYVRCNIKKDLFVMINKHKFKSRYKKIGDEFQPIPNSKVLWITDARVIKK